MKIKEKVDVVMKEKTHLEKKVETLFYYVIECMEKERKSYRSALTHLELELMEPLMREKKIEYDLEQLNLERELKLERILKK